MAGSGKMSMKELDTRLKAVEHRLGELAETLKRIEELASQAQVEAQAAAQRSAEAQAAASRIAEVQAAAPQSAPNGNGAGEHDDKVQRLEAVVGRLDDRVEKITQTLIQQAHRFS
jgi:uncharacterized protein YukE